MHLSEASGVVWTALRNTYHSLLGLVLLNLLWLVSVPTVVLLPPVTAGALAVTNSLAHGTGLPWDEFWAAARRYGWISVRWALLNAAVIAVTAVNLTFYSALDTALGIGVQLVLVVVALVWLATQFYFWPFMLEQEQKSVRVALKNGLFLALAEPLYTGVILFTVGLVVVLSVITVLPVALFTLSFSALLANQAVIERLAAYGKLRQPGVTSDAAILDEASSDETLSDAEDPSA